MGKEKKWPKFKSYFVCKMVLKPPKFELEIEKIRLSKTFLARTKKLANQLSQPLFNTMLQKLAYAITSISKFKFSIRSNGQYVVPNRST